MSIPRLQLAHITKRYPAVVANNDVSLEVQPGETHAVLGENGAGKSTLMKIIYGSVKPDEGSVLWNGRQVRIRNPQEARALGISMVFQHFSLFDTLTVAENVWLGLDKSLSLAQVTASITASVPATDRTDGRPPAWTAAPPTGPPALAAVRPQRSPTRRASPAAGDARPLRDATIASIGVETARRRTCRRADRAPAASCGGVTRRSRSGWTAPGS